MPAEVKTLAQFQAELDAKFAKLEQRVKALESGFGELKVLSKAESQRLSQMIDVWNKSVAK